MIDVVAMGERLIVQRAQRVTGCDHAVTLPVVYVSVGSGRACGADWPQPY